ncbi:MAG: GIY-YIG nuclease family protein [Candidatus Saccharibacteria bacterium]
MDLLHEIWWIYILRCGDNSFYTGITNNIVFRYWQHIHSSGGCKYTRSRQPVDLERCWMVSDKSQALKTERIIKALRRSQKELLVEDPYLLQQFISSSGFEFKIVVGNDNTINKLTLNTDPLTRRQAERLLEENKSLVFRSVP